MLINREQLAWAAGIFEGEGYISKVNSHRSSGWGMRIGINNTDLSLLRHFQKAIGNLGHISKARHLGKKPIWTWQSARFEHVQSVMAMLHPWLLERRRQRYKTLVKRFVRRKLCR